MQKKKQEELTQSIQLADHGKLKQEKLLTVINSYF